MTKKNKQALTQKFPDKLFVFREEDGGDVYYVAYESLDGVEHVHSDGDPVAVYSLLNAAVDMSLWITTRVAPTLKKKDSSR